MKLLVGYSTNNGFGNKVIDPSRGVIGIKDITGIVFEETNNAGTLKGVYRLENRIHESRTYSFVLAVRYANGSIGSVSLCVDFKLVDEKAIRFIEDKLKSPTGYVDAKVLSVIDLAKII